MFHTLVITLLIVAISVLLLGIKIIVLKDGKFPNGHVGSNKALRDKGISCVQSQDKEAREKQPLSLKDM
ncbi:hypothetical protein EZS27_011106 [termite gut metagenome]|jgi:hypothetical protein|uniref:Uncharacterized protein n=1 Tax=termite gut metagenome TaxID=433724 RepID=A0A5J4S4R1_9ZZZZ